MKDFLSIGEVARQTGVPTYRIKYALETLKLPSPTTRFGHQRVFTRKDVERVRKLFGKGAAPSGKDPEQA